MRTGKLTGQTKILLPYIDSEGMRQFQMITINGKIYASKMYAGIKKFVKDNYGVDVDKDWLANVPLIVNSNDPEVKITPEESQKIVEAFIDSVEMKDDDTIEDSPVGGSADQDASQTGEPLCAVSDQPL